MGLFKKKSLKEKLEEEFRRNQEVYPQLAGVDTERYFGYLLLNVRDSDRQLPLAELLEKYPPSAMPDKR